MEQALLPLFPLDVVLFPRTPLPLHIFEDRYKEMISAAMVAQTEFGVVLAGEKGIVNTGCTATIDKVVKRYEDGRLDILTVGRRRFEIIMLNDEMSYLRGAVEFFDDESFDTTPDDLKSRVMEGYHDLCKIEPPEEMLDPKLADPQLSFQLAQILSDLNFRQTLLSTRSESERMKRLADFLPSFNTRQREITHVRTVAPKNGHAKWPAQL